MDRLSKEDRILWATVARTVKPLTGRKVESLPDFEPAAGTDVVPPQAVPEKRLSRSGAKPGPAVIDHPTRRKLSRGSLSIDGRLDLHGLTQNEAHLLLQAFLHRAHREGRRYVLVITGKGSSLGSDGALQRAVPIWLATPSFRPLVSGYELAARNHGGSGALYVRIRRREGKSA